MSTTWSLYLVPDSWTLKDCMCVAYMVDTELMLRDKDELKEFMDYKQANWDDLYDTLIKRPHIYGYTSDDCGSSRHEQIMNLLPPTGRLYSFPDELYPMIKKLKEFAKKYEGKRYICMN